ncbi:VWA domain-containing protein [Corticibacter populi]|uniref:VWA domain-containing protein n=2 Tax=Corticibacter populi TaxID=1550736 RepID=A0A3M6QWL0_9BURK|nr:VWA domain-containing protein [Corticibacter populi]
MAGLVFIGWACLPAATQAGGAGTGQAESPYFYLPHADPALDALPLKATEVDVHVAGVIANVRVRQTYRNEGSRAIEARYLFPGSTHAAVHAMQVRLGERLITAQIREKQQARVDYEEAQRAGKTAALLEQHRPNVFQMNVANILPGDTVQVELRYTELLVPSDGRYQFVFPTVVGPRYNSPAAAQALDTPIAQPVLATAAGATTPADAFTLALRLDSPIPIKAIESPSHALETHIDDNGRRASLRLAADAQGRPPHNRDFILDYRLAGDRVEAGLLVSHGGDAGNGGGDDENFFLAMIEPPKAVPSAQISPRDYIFVVDVSGSMHGFPLQTAKTMLRELIGGLRPTDTFNVLLFSGSNRVLHERSVAATAENIQRAIDTIEHYQGGGGTELMPALRRVYRLPKAPQLSRSVIVVTDGYVSVEREAFALVREHLNEANVFAFGIGSSVNRHLMEGLARAGMGEPFIITDARQARSEAERFRRMVETPVLTSVKAVFDDIDAYDVEPPQLPDVLAQRPVVLFGKWRGTREDLPAGSLRLQGHTAELRYEQRLPFAQTPPVPPGATPAAGNADADTNADAAALHQALRHLWARHRIAGLSDQEALLGDDSQRQAITALGLQYGLLTDYTSFIAIDQLVRRAADAVSAPVDQPTPLPEGVSPLAIGAAVPSTPEPATWGAALLVLSLLALLTRRQHRAGRQRWTR